LGYCSFARAITRARTAASGALVSALRAQKPLTRRNLRFDRVASMLEHEGAMQSLDRIARDVLDSLQEGCQVIDFDWRYLYVNDAQVEHGRLPREQLIGRTMMECYPDLEQQPFFEVLRRCMNERTRDRAEIEFIFADGTPGWFDLRIVPVPDGLCIISLDTSEERIARARLHGAEEQLRQSQKMEAVGVLAGGVAHDFNNLLSVIICYGDLSLAKLSPVDPLREDIAEIAKAADRAVVLTRQLLMFSRQQVLEPKVLRLNEVLAGMERMFQRILGADIDLVSLPGLALGRVKVDPSSLEQVIMNLVVNARDAMPQGGKLTLETGDVLLDEEYAREHLGVVPGPYVMLAVTDTGKGIDKATQARIFEPFFTTKPKGKGTGLGLSTAFGIVKQSGGSIWLYSEVGRGATFKVFLPSVDEPTTLLQAFDSPLTLRGNETILLVEDDDQVRAVTSGILQRNGYQVIEARNAGEALLQAETQQKIDLLLTDVVLPQMNGPELAKRLAPGRPAMKILCMSGYTDDSIVRHGVLESTMAFLQKPITMATLTAKVREVLDSGPPATR
jgi:signal transduction histidine kinase/CheY-like chemotaxis protein